ncbi:MAG: matrixin family metalloprotease [Candidatus Obscuribacterales bacterium]|nr:matrixin family metalloprotease [Candidatus Obscuribacterales bacterium]
MCSNALAQQRKQVKSYEIEHTVYNLCRQSETLIARKSYSEARNLLLEAAKNDRTSYSSYVHGSLAECYLGLKEYQTSLSEAQIALRFDPNYSYALYLQSKAYYELGNFALSADYLKKYNEADKAVANAAQSKRTACNMTAYANLKKASQLIKSGNDSEATKLLQQAIDCDPSPVSAQAHASLSFVFRRRGYLQRAVEEGKKALALDPNDKATVYNIGMTYRDLAKFDDAITWIRRYLSMETDVTQRQNAIACLKGFEADKANFQDPENRLPDYLDQSSAQGHVNKWNQERLPIKIYISSGAGVYGFRSSFPNLVLSALDKWCEASGKKLAYEIVADKSKADIAVKWTSNSFPLTNEHPNTRTAGRTESTFDGLGDVQEATITILTVNPFDTSEGLSNGECASVLTHEVGHALGLGHSSGIRDIMYFCSSNLQHGLSSRDRATIARFYSGYPQIANLPKAKPALPNQPIEYLPVPAFMPPAPPDTTKLEPPLFIPPPASGEKLQPPLFIPPALPKSNSEELPFFMPPKK